MHPRKLSRHCRRGFSLTELLVTIGVVAVLTAMVIPTVGNLTTRSREIVVGDHVEMLNKAVKSFSQNCWQMNMPADHASDADELSVLRSLQYRFPADSLKQGSPYFDPRYNPVASSNTRDFRIRWNGRLFELIPPGTAGTGLRYAGGTEYTTGYSFPPDYQPVGP